MIRTIITLPRELKIWLDNYSKKHNRSTAETIREAISAYKAKLENQTKDGILSKTYGIWKNRKIDSLEYVRKLRDEWK